IQLTVPLTNRAAETDFRTRKVEVEASLLTLKSLQESTLAEVETTHTQILSYEEQIRVARTRIMLAEQNVEAEQARYAAGKSTIREVLEVQKSLRDAQLAAIRAQINALAARVDLELQRGTLLETFGIREIAG
ncbi:MAG: TolC family protein, partial [Myxococcota bacterium]|nr:TolC family protein [Myxococcota bacterium]